MTTTDTITEPLTPAPAPRKRWRWALLLLPVALVAGIVVAAAGGGTETHALSGTFTLIDSAIGGSWDSCWGTGGYDDFGAGMDVTVRDGDGKIIATGTTENLTMADDDAEDAKDANLLCTVKFATEVPVVDFYAVEVGSRGDLSYSRDEMAAQDWKVSLSLGSFDDLIDD